MVGCPVLLREWIIDRWHAHVVEAARRADMQPVFVLVANRDDPTVARFNDVCTDHLMLLVNVEEPRTVDRREWHPPSRFDRMVELRNRLLDTAASVRPDYFWSIDSDILAHPDALTAMVACTDRFDLIGGACFLSPNGLSVSNQARWTKQNNMRREWKPGVEIAVDVVMANKLMTGAVLEAGVRYEFDRHGEDIGFSRAVKEAGLRIGWTSKVVSRHVMAPRYLDVDDKRCHMPTVGAAR